MRYGLQAKVYLRFYHYACLSKRKEYGATKESMKQVVEEYKAIVKRAKDIGKSRLLSAYFLAAYFIALCRSSGLDEEKCYQFLRDGMKSSSLLKTALGNAESYLDPKKLPDRKRWALQSHQRLYENDWVVDILEGNDEYDLGYDYRECGVVKLCQDEGVPQYAEYLCRLDYLLADLMGMELKRTMTIADGDSLCDFRYSRKKS